MYYYPYDPRIHNFGNVGIGGKVQAHLSPFITKGIDFIRYDNRNIRQEVIDYLDTKYRNKHKNILDLCCGSGISTAKYGIDTSPDFIEKARELYPNKIFEVANAENYRPKYNVDVVTSMFAFHEMPEGAHELIIENAIEIANKEIIIMDIHPNYKPSKLMKSGEPYIDEYLDTIQKTMQYHDFKMTTYINNHVAFWNLKLN